MTTETCSAPTPLTFTRWGKTITINPVEVAAGSVAALLSAKASDLDWYRRTLRNAVRGAKRTQRTYHVGRTSTQAHILDDEAHNLPSEGLSRDYTATADGKLYRWVQA